MQTPLVSVVVITFNSAKFVIETLDSIYSQDYSQIELLISDDCSSDNTIDICAEWLKTNRRRFTNATIIKTPHNKGICGNYNYALNHVTGSWIKFIAGDDILCPECVSTFIAATLKSSNKIFFSALIPFSEKNGIIHEKAIRAVGHYCFASNNPIEQLNRIFEVIYYVAEGPTLFIETDTLKATGGMDERYPMLEDLPIAMKYAYGGYPIGFINKPLVKYREYPESVSQSNPQFEFTINIAIRDYKMKVARDERKYLKWWHLYIFNLLDRKKMSGAKIMLPICKIILLTDFFTLKNKFISSKK